MQPESQIRAGDIVIVRSGGPKLTVSETWCDQGREYVSVTWFDDGGELKNHVFVSDALTHAV